MTKNIEENTGILPLILKLTKAYYAFIQQRYFAFLCLVGITAAPPGFHSTV